MMPSTDFRINFLSFSFFGRELRIRLLRVGVCIICLFATVSPVGSMTLPDTVGLTWGISLAQVRQMNVPIEEEWPVWDQVIAVRTGTIENELPRTGSLILVFHQKHGLIKMHWASLPIQRDATGSKGIEAFNKIKDQLMATYGPSSQSSQEANVRLHGFNGDFYECLQETTCGKWESIWETTEGEAVILELIGLDSGAGFLQMTHQCPNLGTILHKNHRKSGKSNNEI